MVASRCPQRFAPAALISFSISVSVKCSRVLNSAFGRRLGVTVRFSVVGATIRKFGFIRVFVLVKGQLYKQWLLYGQLALAVVGLLYVLRLEIETDHKPEQLGGAFGDAGVARDPAAALPL